MGGGGGGGREGRGKYWYSMRRERLPSNHSVSNEAGVGTALPLTLHQECHFCIVQEATSHAHGRGAEPTRYNTVVPFVGRGLWRCAQWLTTPDPTQQGVRVTPLPGHRIGNAPRFLTVSRSAPMAFRSIQLMAQIVQGRTSKPSQARACRFLSSWCLRKPRRLTRTAKDG